MSARTTSAAPSSVERAAISSTRPGSTAPSKGQPKATLIDTLTGRSVSIAASVASASSGVAFWFSRPKLSVAARLKCSSSRPVAAKRSAPFAFSTRPE